jgi:hypothetical protein
MPFDGAEAIPLHLQSQAPLALMEFLRHLPQLVPDSPIEVDGPGRSGDWWIELALGGLAPAIGWRDGAGFAIYGPGPTLPEQPNAVLACPHAAALRLARMLRSWQKPRLAADQKSCRNNSFNVIAQA